MEYVKITFLKSRNKLTIFLLPTIWQILLPFIFLRHVFKRSVTILNIYLISYLILKLSK